MTRGARTSRPTLRVDILAARSDTLHQRRHRFPRGDHIHFVVLGIHSPEICPTSNAKTKALLLETAPQIPGIAQKHGVNIVAGPFVNWEHTTVLIVETGSAEALDDFLVAIRLPQWNQVRILPSHHLQEAIKDVQEGTPLF